MSLINCPECGDQISDKASSCPRCGAPVSKESIATVSNLVTTQETSKTLKLHALISGLIMMIGVVAIVIAAQGNDSPGFGALMTFGGLFWFIVTRVRTWWHHK